MSRINLTIDRIVLRGFEPAERNALLEAFQTELRRMLAESNSRGDWALSHRVPVLKLGRMAFSPGLSGSRNFGTRIARAIAKGLGR